MPIAIVKNIHLDSINDIAWMGDSLIIVASSDGFCSFIQLQKDLVGERLETDSTLIPDKMKEFYKMES
jgi:chromatin assembly factor 1 subunit B